MTRILEHLSPCQRQAVTHVEGPLLTLAGPGSGKTRVVTHRIAYMIQNGVSPHSILALTFTNKAAQEMRRRLEGLVGDNQVWMGTFHGYAARFLRRYGRLVGLPENYSIWEPADAKVALRSAIRDSGVSLTHLNEELLIQEISRMKNRLITPDVVEGEQGNHRQHVISQVYPAYQRELLRCGACDFDCLLLHTAHILRHHPELRFELDARHRFILVDEYQDTNLAQYIIVRALSVDHPNLNVTGDPDQSIYGWRGASIDNILKFERDYQNVTVVRLEDNYRSTPEILAVADCLIQNNTHRKAKSLIPTRPSGCRVELNIFPDATQEARHVIDQIQQAIIDRGSRPSEFAVLYRTNAQSRLLEKELLRRHMAYQLIGGFRFYQRQEIKDLLAYLTLLFNPADDVAFGRAANTPPRGLGEKSLVSVAELARASKVPRLEALRQAVERGILSRKANQGAAQFLELLDGLAGDACGSIADLLQSVLDRTNYLPFLQAKRADTPDDSLQENIRELMADAMEVDAMYPGGGGLETFLEQICLASDTDQWESSSDRITLMTLHAAKGLEFPNVFIIAIEQNVLPHARCTEDPSQYEEERRLFFVGITRAKDRLQLSMAKRRGFAENRPGEGRMTIPSTFLMELPRTEMAFRDWANAYGSWPGDYSEDPDCFEPPGASDHDEYSQVPPDDWDDDSAPRQRKSNASKESMGPTSPLLSGARFMATARADPQTEDGFQVGVLVEHPEYGLGRIVSIGGRGLKRVARVRFFDSGDERSYYLHKAYLKLHDEPIS